MSDLKPWWEGKRYATLGSASLSADWAENAIAEDALKQRRPFYDNSIDGSATISLDELQAQIEALGGKLVFSNPRWRGDLNERRYFAWDDGFVCIYESDGEMGGRCITMDRDLFFKVKDILEKAAGPKASGGRVYVMMTTPEGAKLKSLGSAATALERDNYNPEVLEDFDAVVADLKSAEPSGRLSIFDGDPGTGKTYLSRALLSAVPDALFVLVPVSLVQELASPGLIGALLETRKDKGDLPTVFLIEDADDCLGSRREGSNVNAVSALLNLSDGIIGALMDIRVVCTTNLKGEELDQAVTREGRLSRLSHVGHLARPVAEKLFEKLTGKKVKIDEKLTLAQVYRLARDDGWKPPPKKRRMGFGSDDSDDISLPMIIGEGDD
jgi:hypothetical protein